MKVKFIFSAIIISVLVFVSCKNKDDVTDEDCLSIYNIVTDGSANIVGEWKLVKTFSPRSNQCFDYSKCSVVFEFSSDNILTISGETIHALPSFGYNLDKCSYSFIEPNYQNGFATLKIHNFYFWHKISAKELVIDDSPSDGGMYYLVKSIKKIKSS